MILEGISVIICCYNSSERLEKTIAYLNKQITVVLKNFEIIVVDNNSIDDTFNKAKELSKKYFNLNIKTIIEINSGLTYARNSGVDFANYEFIIFCDDDNLLFPDYIEKAYNYFKKNPQFSAFGGEGLFMNDDIPDIIKKNKLIYAIGKQANCSKEVTFEKGYLYGAGLCVRKQAYLNSKPKKSLLTDRKGNNLSSGGDTELCFNLVLNGYKIAYFDDLKFYHAVPKERLTINYIRKFKISSAKESYLLDGLQYKAQIHPKMFNKPYKRSWFIKLIRELLFIPKIDKVNNLKTVLSVKKLKIIQLLKLNFNYDRSFK